MLALRYWLRLFRFAILGQDPQSAGDVPVWALTVPLRRWSEAHRYSGQSFAASYGKALPKEARAFVPMRALYLVFLALWPLIALWRAMMPGPSARQAWRHAMTRPEMAMAHAGAVHGDDEIAWSRPDYAVGMLYAELFCRTRARWFWLDDKRLFAEAAKDLGLPTPPTLTLAEAAARGGRFIVKDPTKDLGYGVWWLSVDELMAREDRDQLIIQERLANHPDLMTVFPPEAPLSNLRVITILDPQTREPRVLRCAVRMGRAGKIVDNTQQGGIWAGVDLVDGTIREGVTRKSYGHVEDGKPIRYRIHPDTEKTFVGLKVPWWDEGRAMAALAHRKLVPEAPTVGWDIGLCEGKPVFLELNVWATGYDYDPPDDAFGPTAEWIVRALKETPRSPG